MQTITQVTTGHICAFAARERRRVDGKAHAQHGLVHFETWQWYWAFDVGDGVSDVDIVDTSQDEQVTGHDGVNFFATNTDELRKIRNATLQHWLSVAFRLAQQRNGFTFAQCSGVHAPDAEATEIVAGVQVGHQSLERRGCVALWCWNRVENCVEQRHQVGIRAWHANSLHGSTLAGYCRNHRKVQVVVGVGEI